MGKYTQRAICRAIRTIAFFCPAPHCPLKTTLCSVKLRTLAKVADIPIRMNVEKHAQPKTYCKYLYYKILEIFPDARRYFLKQQCLGKSCSDIDLIIDTILSMPDYPKREIITTEEVEEKIDVKAQYAVMKEVLPNADPDYLMDRLETFQSQAEVKEFIANALAKRDYPTYQEYDKKRRLTAQFKQYTTEFSVERFVSVISNPEEYFNSPERQYTPIVKNGQLYNKLLNCLKSFYPLIPVKAIKQQFDKTLDIRQTCKLLDNYQEVFLKSKRYYPLDLPIINDIPLLQYLCYLKNREQINKYLHEQEIKLKKERKHAKLNNLLRTCNCCYDDQVMPADTVCCQSGCAFCKRCLARSVEIGFGEGRLTYPCLSDCGSNFELQVIQVAVDQKLFSKLAQKKQLEEVKSAGIEDLEFCPFCDFATILPAGNNVFTCLNPDCMKESCKLCKDISHVPLKCSEVEKDDDVKTRTSIENKMTEALMRVCYKCGTKFIKEDGCNKMTCPCGALMCYVCKKPIADYKHFNGQGGTRFDLCPLYSDTNLLHRDTVIKVAKEAKANVGIPLKVDPAADVMRHYKELMKKKPSKVPPGM